MDIHIHQDKFHRIIFKTYRIKKMDPKEQTIRSLLCYYQELACVKYPSISSFEKVLGYHYDARFKVTLSSFGSYSILEYALFAIDPEFIEDSSYSYETLKQLFLDAQQALFIDGMIDDELYDRAYETYESDLLAKQERQQTNALRGALSTYFKGTTRDFQSAGDLKTLMQIKKEELYQYYLTVLKEEKISLSSGLNSAFVNEEQITLTPKKDYYFKERKTVSEFVEQPADCNQCYLEIIFETGIYASDNLYYACVLTNYMFGGSSSSNLFLIMREKYGLCYSVNSMYLGATGILIVSAIIDKCNLNKALEACDEALNELSCDKKKLDEVKSYYLSSYRANEDYQETGISSYLSDHYFLDTPKSYKETDAIKSVKESDIKKVIEQLKRSFVYVYGGNE